MLQDQAGRLECGYPGFHKVYACGKPSSFCTGCQIQRGRSKVTPEQQVTTEEAGHIKFDGARRSDERPQPLYILFLLMCHKTGPSCT